MSTNNRFSLDIVSRVYEDARGVYIEVTPDSEIGEDCLRISTRGTEKSKEYYGDVELGMTIAQAELLIEGIETVIMAMKKTME